MSELAERLATLSPEKRALLLQQLKKRDKVNTSFAIQPYKRATNEVLPSFAQQRLWFMDQLVPGQSIYNIAVALDMQGPIQLDALHGSFQQIIERHDGLRTIFQVRQEHPMQIIIPTLPLFLPMVDLSIQDATLQESLMQDLAKQEAGRPFDLERGPLLRLSLLRMHAQRHILLLTMHHIISDGWSLQIVIDELCHLYTAAVTQQESPLPPLPIQYADYTLWQRQWLQGEPLQQHLTYWHQQLSGVTPLILPTDHPRPAIQTYGGATQSQRLSPELSEGLQALSQQEHVTLFMTLLASFQVLLMRYSGQNDISVGTPIANRQHIEMESVIGFFVNTLVMRTDLSGDPTFVEVLQRVREVCLGAYTHQDVPFEQVVEVVETARDLSRSPLFQVMFILQNAPRAQKKLANVQVRELSVEDTISKFDLTLSITETKDGLDAMFEYNTDLFDAETIQRLLGHWQIMLEGIVSNAQSAVRELPLLSAREQSLILKTWNATDASYPQERGIHQFFEQQVQHTPDAIALIFEGQMLTYSALDQRANQVAHSLQRQSVGPEVIVAIYMERSLEMVIGLLAVLKAGGAYLPLDPAFPSERLRTILEEAKPMVVLTQTHLPPLMESFSTSIVYLDTDWLRFAQAPRTSPDVMVQPEHSAYLIYTSGSTGRPKGIQISHRSVVNLLLSLKQQLGGVTAQDCMVALTTISFDIAELELYLPLFVGARLVIGSAQVAVDSEQLAQLLTEQAATIVQATPTAWQQLLLSGWAGIEALKILCGGEALSLGVAQQLLHSGAQLWNMYGPTETTIYSTGASLHLGIEEVSIGRPLANTQIYLLDSLLQPVPLGASGALYIGGAGLARGYYQQPVLTAERFIPDPFSQEPGARLYWTGDLARYHIDGRIEYLGRMDQQVKLRGFRIELGEIETTLRHHPSVQDSVVLVREQAHGNKSLVAYLLVQPEQAPTPAELRDFLRQRIPAYMVPSAFMILESFPITPNGKLDRLHFPAPQSQRESDADSYVAARSPLEEVLVTIWEDLLEKHPIGIHDNFFELGGHSLLVVQMVNRINTLYGISLTASILFQKQTIEQLGELLQQMDAHTLPPSSLIVSLRKGGNKQPFFCVHPASGDLYNYLGLARYLDPEQPLYGIQAQGITDGQEPLTSVEEMATAYVHALLTQQPDGSYLLGGHSIGGLIAFEMARQLEALGKNVAGLILLDGVLASQEEVEQARLISVNEIQVLAGLIEILKYYASSVPTVSDEEFLQRSLDEQQSYLLDCLKVAQVLPQEMTPAQFQSQIRIFQANAYSQQAYRPQGRYQGKVTLLYCEQGNYDPIAMWSPFAVKEEMMIQAVPGNHYSMLNEPFVNTVATHTQRFLNQFGRM